MPLRRYGIVKKLPNARSDTSQNLKSLILEYLDCTKKEDFRSSIWDDSIMQNESSKDSQFIHSSVVPFGYVKNKTSTLFSNNPSELEQSLENLYGWWLDSTKNKKVKFHHFVFSISPNSQKLLSERTDDLGLSLMYAVEEVFCRYNSFFYSDDSVGGLFGIHKDTDNLHAHVLLHPNTDSGKRIGVSHHAKVKSGKKESRVDYQGFIKQSFNQALYDFCNYRRDSFDRKERGNIFDISLCAALLLDQNETIDPRLILQHRESVVSSPSSCANALGLIHSEVESFKSRMLSPQDNEMLPLCDLLVESCEEYKKSVSQMVNTLSSLQGTIDISENIRKQAFESEQHGERCIGLAADLDENEKNDLILYTKAINKKLNERQELNSSDGIKSKKIKLELEDNSEKEHLSMIDLSIYSQGLIQEIGVTKGEIPRQFDIEGSTKYRLYNSNQAKVKKELQATISNYSVDNSFKYKPFIFSIDAGREFVDTEIVNADLIPDGLPKYKEAHLDKSINSLPKSLNAFTDVVQKPSMEGISL